MDEAENATNGENMELLEGEAEFTKEKVEDENIISLITHPPHRLEISTNFIFDTFPK